MYAHVCVCVGYVYVWDYGRVHLLVHVLVHGHAYDSKSMHAYAGRRAWYVCMYVRTYVCMNKAQQQGAPCWIWCSWGFLFGTLGCALPVPDCLQYAMASKPAKQQPVSKTNKMPVSADREADLFMIGSGLLRGTYICYQ